MSRIRRIRRFELIFLSVFAVFLSFSIILSVFLRLSQIALALLMMDFIVVTIVAIFGSLSIREEEEEKS